MPPHVAYTTNGRAGQVPGPTREEAGAEDGTRTRDLLLGKEALYQLSYFRLSAGAADRGATVRRIGAGDRIRTGDTQLGKLVLCQLSYARAPSPGLRLVGGRGLEPLTFCA